MLPTGLAPAKPYQRPRSLNKKKKPSTRSAGVSVICRNVQQSTPASGDRSQHSGEPQLQQQRPLSTHTGLFAGHTHTVAPVFAPRGTLIHQTLWLQTVLAAHSTLSTEPREAGGHACR